jgi:hypothetical protein
MLDESGDRDDRMYTNALRLMNYAELENYTAGLTYELRGDLWTCICCKGYKQAQSKLHDILQLFEYSLVIPEEDRSGPEGKQLEAMLSEILLGCTHDKMSPSHGGNTQTSYDRRPEGAPMRVLLQNL